MFLLLFSVVYIAEANNWIKKEEVSLDFVSILCIEAKPCDDQICSSVSTIDSSMTSFNSNDNVPTISAKIIQS